MHMTMKNSNYLIEFCNLRAERDFSNNLVQTFGCHGTFYKQKIPEELRYKPT